MDVGQEDLSQVFALASIWILFLAFGSSACLVPMVYTVGLAYQEAFNPGFSYINQAFAFSMLNAILFMALGSVIGYPIASASGKLNCIHSPLKYFKNFNCFGIFFFFSFSFLPNGILDIMSNSCKLSM